MDRLICISPFFGGPDGTGNGSQKQDRNDQKCQSLGGIPAA
jgi:hypothetical protein